MSLRRRILPLWRGALFSDAVISQGQTRYWFQRIKLRLIGNFKIMSKVALFPGSFDPFTSGHLNILTRALTIFDEVVVAVGINQAKRGFYTMSQREDIIAQATKDLKGVKIISYDGLTVDLCKELGIKHIVRGVRNMTDFDNEQAVADANRHLAPDIDTIIIPTAQEYSHISSSAVRDLLSHHGDLSRFIPDWVVLPEIV